mgnify:CR=1 FL=1
MQGPLSTQLENVLASLGEAVILADAQGVVWFSNAAAQELLGCSEAYLRGRRCAELFCSAPTVGTLFERTVQTGQTQVCGELPLPLADRTLTVRLSCSPVWASDGTLQGAALVLHDLSYQRKLEETARRNENLARLGTLVAGLAHEIKNPLGGIRGAAQLLAQRLRGDGEAEEFTSILIRETDRLARLVDQLLQFGHPAPLKIEAVNVHKVLHQVLELLRPELEALHIQATLTVDPSLPETRGDADQLTQLFLNLLRNACEAMPQGGRLRVSTKMETDFHLFFPERPAKFLRVEIADSGPGFSPEALARAGELFYTTKPAGTGLGLAICQRIVANHGGDLRVANQPEGGGVVMVHLPVGTNA